MVLGWQGGVTAVQGAVPLVLLESRQARSQQSCIAQWASTPHHPTRTGLQSCQLVERMRAECVDRNLPGPFNSLLEALFRR